MRIPSQIKSVYNLTDFESDCIADLIWYWSRTTRYQPKDIFDLVVNKLNKGLHPIRVLNSRCPDSLMYMQTPEDFSRVYKK